MIRSLVILGLCLGLAACAPRAGTQAVGMQASGMIASVGTQIAARRAAAGVQPLAHSPNLQGAAQAQATDLQTSGRFDHMGTDGSTVSDRVARAGFGACFVAENIARGQPDSRSVIAGWMGSPEHRANLLSPAATQFGFARAGEVWVLVLARPC